MKVLNYRILLRKEAEGGYTVIVPSLPGCVTYGDKIEEAIEMAKEAIELYIESLKELDEEITNRRRNFRIYANGKGLCLNSYPLLLRKISRYLKRRDLYGIGLKGVGVLISKA